MKFFAFKPSSLTRAFLMVFGFTPDQKEVKSLEEADVCLVTNSGDLRKAYRPDKFFGFIPIHEFEKENSKKQPDNVFVLNGNNLFHDEQNGAGAFKRAFDAWQETISSKKSDQPDSAVSNLAALSKSYFVLVVDDTVANLEIAMARLVGQQIILAQGPEEALRYLRLEGRMPDAVLTDLKMRPDKAYGSLSLDVYGVTETVHSGFAVMLEATKRGIPVAIVTDGNHHQDWASAMFDHIKEVEVNGQKVLFFNDIGKRWDYALKALVETE